MIVSTIEVWEGQVVRSIKLGTFLGGLGLRIALLLHSLHLQLRVVGEVDAEDQLAILVEERIPIVLVARTAWCSLRSRIFRVSLMELV